MAFNTRADQKGQFVLHTVGTGLTRTDQVAITSTPTGVTGTYATGGGTNALVGGTHTGGIGSTAYTIGDIVAALKTNGLIPK